MASAVKGVNKTKYDAGGSGSSYIPAGEYNSQILTVYDTYEAGALATGSTISMINLPQSAKIVDMYLAFDDLGNTVTIKVGDSTDDDRYISAASVASAGLTRMSKVGGIMYTIGTNTSDDVIVLTTSGSITGGTIKLVVEYTSGG